MLKHIRRLSVVLWVALLSLVSLGLLQACGDEYAQPRKVLSETREDVLVGESEHFSITVYLGQREDPYALDGTANPLTAYCLVIVTPKFDTEEADQLTARLAAGGQTFTAVLARHPYNGQYAADIPEADLSSGAAQINVTGQHYDEDVTVRTLRQEGDMTMEEAFRKGLADLAEPLAGTLQNGEYACEIQVRLAERPDGKLFWHVLICDRQGGMFAVLYDVREGGTEIRSQS